MDRELPIIAAGDVQNVGAEICDYKEKAWMMFKKMPECASFLRYIRKLLFLTPSPPSLISLLNNLM